MIELTAKPLAREAVFLNGLGLSDADIARATGSGTSTVRAWLAGTRNPSGERAERLIELAALVERLQLLIEAEYIPIWMKKPVPALGDEKPLDRIAQGNYREVAALISSLEGTTAS